MQNNIIDNLSNVVKEKFGFDLDLEGKTECLNFINTMHDPAEFEDKNYCHIIIDRDTAKAILINSKYKTIEIGSLNDNGKLDGNATTIIEYSASGEKKSRFVGKYKDHIPQDGTRIIHFRNYTITEEGEFFTCNTGGFFLEKGTRILKNKGVLEEILTGKFNENFFINGTVELAKRKEIHSGTFVNGSISKGKIQFSTGEKWEGTFDVNGLLNGKTCSKTFPNGTKQLGRFKNGNATEECEFLDKNGNELRKVTRFGNSLIFKISNENGSSNEYQEEIIDKVSSINTTTPQNIPTKNLINLKNNTLEYKIIIAQTNGKAMNPTVVPHSSQLIWTFLPQIRCSNFLNSS